MKQYGRRILCLLLAMALMLGIAPSVLAAETDVQKIPTDPKEIVDAAFALEKGASLPYYCTLVGKITAIVTEYSEQYRNITVDLQVTGSDGYKTIECYRLKGEGANQLEIGDIITVTGQLTRYYKAATEDKAEVDKIEFNAGCTLVRVVKGSEAEDVLTGTESEFRVVGNADWMGNWDPASNAGRMLEVEPGVYKQIFKNVPPGCYELKITRNGTWDQSWGNNGNNVCFTATKRCHITVTFTLTETESTIRISGVGLVASNGDHEYARQLIPATCEQGSYYANVCILCGNMDPESALEELTPPLGHSYDAKVVSATCTQEGYTVHTCARCGDTYTGGTVPAFGHRFTGYISDGNATCTEDGTKSSTCRLCGEKKTTADPGSALGHSFTNYLDDYNAFCWRDGTKTARCDRCHATDTVTIPGSALPHTFDGGECIYCGAVENSAILGDISGDGKVNIGDVARLYAHIRGSAMLDEETLLACADLSGDGKVNIGDVARLYAQVRA